MKKEINKLFSDFIIRATECRNTYGECTVELNRFTCDKLFSYIQGGTIATNDTHPARRYKKKHVAFGSELTINNRLSDDLILFNPSGRALILK